MIIAHNLPILLFSNWQAEMINKTHFILYVEDQKTSTEFYSKVLQDKPSLNVPGMTEFALSENAVLGIMPSAGIKRLLGEKLQYSSADNKKPRAELYLIVNEPGKYLQRAIAAGAIELSPLLDRDWGHRAGYYFDKDGYVIAFAEII